MTVVDVCTKCGKTTSCHPFSFDSVGGSYIDEVAGDMLCDQCFANLTKKPRLKKGGKS